MDARKTVSVIIPVFNGEETIAAAIDSALAQEFDGEVEVVVVNDGSTDATAAVLDTYHGRITLLDRANRGPAAARNAGVRASRGEYVAFLDADDIWLPDKLERTVTALERDADAALVYTNAWKIDSTGRRTGATYTPESQKRAPTMEDLLSELWNILPSTAVIKRATFDRIGGFCEDFATAHPQWEDGYFMLLARTHGRFVYLDEPTVLYRVMASVAGGLKRRRVWNHDGERPESIRVERYVRNSDLMQRLIRERFGRPADGLIAAIRRATVNLLTGVGLTAMVQRDRHLARSAYLLALHYGPLNPKIYLRLAWTYLPERVARAICALLPSKLQRFVSGPAHA